MLCFIVILNHEWALPWDFECHMTCNRFEVTKNLCENQKIVVYLRLLSVILAQLNEFELMVCGECHTT